MNAKTLLIVIIAAAALALPGCGGDLPSVPQVAVPATVEGQEISARMSDEAVLKVFRVDISKAEKRSETVANGSVTTYVQGSQEVTISRTGSPPLYIVAFGPISGTWKADR